MQKPSAHLTNPKPSLKGSAVPNIENQIKHLQRELRDLQLTFPKEIQNKTAISAQSKTEKFKPNASMKPNIQRIFSPVGNKTKTSACTLPKLNGSNIHHSLAPIGNKIVTSTRFGSHKNLSKTSISATLNSSLGLKAGTYKHSNKSKIMNSTKSNFQLASTSMSGISQTSAKTLSQAALPQRNAGTVEISIGTRRQKGSSKIKVSTKHIASNQCIMSKISGTTKAHLKRLLSGKEEKSSNLGRQHTCSRLNLSTTSNPYRDAISEMNDTINSYIQRLKAPTDGKISTTTIPNSQPSLSNKNVSLTSNDKGETPIVSEKVKTKSDERIQFNSSLIKTPRALSIATNMKDTKACAITPSQCTMPRISPFKKTPINRLLTPIGGKTETSISPMCDKNAAVISHIQCMLTSVTRSENMETIKCTLPEASKKRSGSQNVKNLLIPCIGRAATSTPQLSPDSDKITSSKKEPNLQRTIKPTSLLVTGKDPSGEVNTQTLSSFYRTKVIDAYRSRRIFTIHGNSNYQPLRKSLLRRGWLEKLAPGQYQHLSEVTEEILLMNSKRGNDYEIMAVSKIINNFPAFSIWQPKGLKDASNFVLPYRNRIRRTQSMDFSNKVGLIGCAQQRHWYQISGLCGLSFPRTYNFRNEEDRIEFTEDYRQTQCRNLIRFIIEKSVNPKDIADENNGKVLPSGVLRYAMNSIKAQINEWEHNSLDQDDPGKVFDQTLWKQFLVSSVRIISGIGKLKSSVKDLNDFVSIAKGYLEKIDERHPEYKWDGVQNLWILKPGFKSRGNGIIIRKSLDEILQHAAMNENRKYIVQKYVERPLLVHKYKFDIRQYMLLSIGEKIASIWLYKDCYFKISSQEFTNDDLRETIHVTNFTVQKRSRITKVRDPRLPKCHMWTLEEFKEFLREQNAPEHFWTEKIFAGFKKNLITVVMSSFEETNFVENAFELYGCDFMLDAEYNPILLEINHTPDLSPSTDVTAKLCPMVLHDLVKVIVDLPRNSSASTGLFEKIFEINYTDKEGYDLNAGLSVKGKSLKFSESL